VRGEIVTTQVRGGDIEGYRQEARDVIWLAFESNKLSKRAKEAIGAGRLQGGLAIAWITFPELAWLTEKGRVETTLCVESVVRLCVSK
jgi:PIN domain nuclease of toxin-antitoxin system